MSRVLLIGKDGRTDCIAEAVCQAGASLFSMSDLDTPGLRRKSVLFQKGKTDDPSLVLEFAKRAKADIAIIGPEEPLAAGVVDALLDFGLPCVGPTRELAQVESSKSFTRGLLTKHGIPGNIEHRVFESLDGMADYLRYLGHFVVKADGLMGGKGVKVSGEQLPTFEDGLKYAAGLLRRGGRVVIEEKIEGEEFSLQSFCDGETVIDTVPVQDHKRAWVGDKGLNTGGMGSYSCENHSLPFLTPDHLREASEINKKVASALVGKRGPYRGILYGGFMATPSGVRVLEYNARFGDPEAMNVIPLLRGRDTFLRICEAITTGTLGRQDVEFERKATVCKYLVPEGYPDSPARNVRLPINAIPPSSGELRTYFAALQEEHGHFVLTGSRAIAFVGIANTVSRAAEIAEEAISRVDGPVYHRSDIGTVQLLQSRVDHYNRLCSATPPKHNEAYATA